MKDILFAEFSYAGSFEPAEVLGSAYYDGSVVVNSDLITAITHCIEELGYEQSNVVIDGLYAMPRDLKQVDTTGWTSLHMLKRFYTNNL